MEVNLFVESLMFLVLGISTLFVFSALMVVIQNAQAKNGMHSFLLNVVSMHMSNSTLGLLQNGNFAVVAARAASIKSYNKKSKQ